MNETISNEYVYNFIEYKIKAFTISQYYKAGEWLKSAIHIFLTSILSSLY